MQKFNVLRLINNLLNLHDPVVRAAGCTFAGRYIVRASKPREGFYCILAKQFTNLRHFVHDIGNRNPKMFHFVDFDLNG